MVRASESGKYDSGTCTVGRLVGPRLEAAWMEWAAIIQNLRWGKPTRAACRGWVFCGEFVILWEGSVGIPQRDPNVAKRQVAGLRLEVRAVKIKILCRSTSTSMGCE